MNFKKIYLLAAGLVLLGACAEEKPVEVVEFPYAFTFTVETSDGLTGYSKITTAPEVTILVTSGDDVDYVADYSVDGSIDYMRKNNIWVDTPALLPFSLTAGQTVVGTHRIEGEVYRADGKGDRQKFSASFKMTCEPVKGIEVVRLDSEALPTFYEIDRGKKLYLPPHDSGTVTLRVTPAESVIASFEGSGSLVLGKDFCVRSADGLVRLKYHSDAPGTATMKADWGTGSESVQYSVKHYPCMHVSGSIEIVYPDDLYAVAELCLTPLEDCTILPRNCYSQTVMGEVSSFDFSELYPNLERSASGTAYAFGRWFITGYGNEYDVQMNISAELGSQDDAPAFFVFDREESVSVLPAGVDQIGLEWEKKRVTWDLSLRNDLYKEWAKNPDPEAFGKLMVE